MVKRLLRGKTSAGVQGCKGKPNRGMLHGPSIKCRKWSSAAGFEPLPTKLRPPSVSTRPTRFGRLCLFSDGEIKGIIDSITQYIFFPLDVKGSVVQW